MIDAAVAAAKLSPGVRRYRVGAALYQRKRLLTVGSNSLKTHPKVLKHFEYPYLHAECEAILRAGLDNCEDTTLIVARLRMDGSFGLAKPCECCEALARDVGIRDVIYTRNDGGIATYRLRN